MAIYNNTKTLMVIGNWILFIGIPILFGFQSSCGNLIEDEVNQNVPITKITMHFQKEIYTLISKLPSRKYCWFITLVTDRSIHNRTDVSTYLEQFGMPLHNGEYVSLTSKCYQYSILREHRNESFAESPIISQIAISAAAVYIYNTLPVTFQCHMLKTLAFYQGFHLRSSKDNNNDVTQDLLIVEQSIQRRYGIKSIALACSQSSVQGGEVSRTVKIQGKIKDGSWSVWNKHFKRKLSKLLGKYSKVDPSFPQPSYQSPRSSPQSLYHLHLVKVHSKGPSLIDVDFHVHMKEANTKAIPANALMSALDEFNRTVLQRDLHIQNGLNYTAVELKPEQIKTVTVVTGTRKQRLKQLLPVYLGHYFSLLPSKAKCSIVDAAIKKGNTTMQEVLSFLSRRHIDRTLRCHRNVVIPTLAIITESNDPGKTTTIPMFTYFNHYNEQIEHVVNFPMQQIPNPSSNPITTVPTVIELTLIVVVSILLISIFVFIGICILYRKRKFQMESLNENNQESANHQINNYEIKATSINTPLSYHSSQSSLNKEKVTADTQSCLYLHLMDNDIEEINHQKHAFVSIENNQLPHTKITSNDTISDRNELHTLV